MAAINFLIPLLVTFMLFTGVCNTLLTKYQDNICVRNCDDPDPKNHKLFEQPVIQTAQMFIGEMGTWLFVGLFALRRRYLARGTTTPNPADYEPVSATEDAPELDASSIMSTTPMNPVGKPHPIKEERIPLTGWRVLLLSLPAICDILGTTLMNVGLLFVVASIYQMTRGALVLFVGLFSVLFLRKRLHAFQWLALVTVVLGVGVVGLAGAIYRDPKAAPSATIAARDAVIALTKRAKSPEALQTILGIFLIAGAQIFTASQFVFEEYILEKYELEPLKVVGWEGIFGFSVTLIGMIVLHLAIGQTDAGRYGYFDLVEAWREITQYRSIGVSSFLIMISIGGFNFFGLSVTRTVSATSRSTIDTCRTLFIWIASLFLGWETFKWLQVLGFVMLVYGTFLFNGLVRPPLRRCFVPEQEEELLPEEAVEPPPTYTS